MPFGRYGAMRQLKLPKPQGREQKHIEVDYNERMEIAPGEEIWLPVAQAPKYEVSNLGRIRRITTGHFPKQWPLPRGDRFICAVINVRGQNRLKTLYVARAVLTAFSKWVAPGKKWFIAYRNGDKADCRLENLHYRSASDTMRTTWAKGKFANRKPIPCVFGYGPAHRTYNHCITDQICLSMIARHKECQNYAQVAREFDTNKEFVRRVVLGVLRRHLQNGHCS